MRRRLPTVFAVLSLILCVATSVLWAVSVRRTVRWQAWRLERRSDPMVIDYRTVSVSRGTFAIDRPHYVVRAPPDIEARLRDETYDGGAGTRWLTEDPPGPNWRRPHTTFARLGFAWGPIADSAGRSTTITGGWVEWPAWVVVVVTATLPAWWVVGWRRRRQRLKRGLCPSCGYDLRASPGRCPECGATAGANA